MEALLKSQFLSYLDVAIFLGLMFAWAIFRLLKNMRKEHNKKTTKAFMLGTIFVVLSFWIWLFLGSLYPVALAYYEYSNDIVEEKEGVITQKERSDRDYMSITIDNIEYRIAYSNDHPLLYKDIRRGHTVTFKYGKNSKYIFEIYESE